EAHVYLAAAAAAAPAEDRAEHTADDLAPDRGADAARGAARRHLGEPFVMAAARPGGAEQDVAQHAAALRTRGTRRRRLPPRLLRRVRARGRAALELLVRRFAVDRGVVRAGDERARDQRLALLGRDRADLAAG